MRKKYVMSTAGPDIEQDMQENKITRNCDIRYSDGVFICNFRIEDQSQSWDSGKREKRVEKIFNKSEDLCTYLDDFFEAVETKEDD